jgi:hypothetical protein
VIRHRLQLSFASCAKAMNIAYEPLTTGGCSREHLVNQVLKRFKEFSGLSLQELRVVAVNIKHWPGNPLLYLDPQLETGRLKHVV